MSDIQTPVGNESLRLHELIPDKLVGFRTVTDYLPVAIGLYKQFLPKDYFEDIFKRCKSFPPLLGDVSPEETSPQYKAYVLKLKSFIIEILTRYKQQHKETDFNSIENDDEFFKEVRHGILDKLLMLEDIEDEEEKKICKSYTIKYLTTQSHPKYTERSFIVDHIDKDILDILIYLYNLSLFKPPEGNFFDSYKLFCQNVIVHMRANQDVNYPKSIVNYTCFMYDIKGYPYLTPSQRIYSINNYSKYEDNKFNNVIIYMKNTDALISYLYDITFMDENTDEVLEQEWILRTAYCLCIALLAYRSEYLEYQTVICKLFGNDKP